MAVILDKVVPFGRTFGEYEAMFNLTSDDLKKNILSVADGPASFNAELTARGGRVVSVDPIYRFTAAAIEAKFYEVLDGIINQVINTPEDWVWSFHTSPQNLKENRIRATNLFTKDYGFAKGSYRYVEGALPTLPFDHQQFELALCSHFLLLYSYHFDYEFHLQSVREMLRVAKEVRIFPLVTLLIGRSPHVDNLVRDLECAGYNARIERVAYEIQRGGNEMLVINRRE
jgi:hypothetical protein